MPASSIGITDVGQVDNVFRKNMASRPEISRCAADRTWQSSQRIVFRTPPSSRTWRPSQGIVFSRSKSSPGSPWSADYGNGGARALTTSAQRETCRPLGVSTLNDPNGLPTLSRAQKSLFAPLGSIEQQVEDPMSIGERQVVSKKKFHSKRRNKAMPKNYGHTPRDIGIVTGRSIKFADHHPVDNENIETKRRRGLWISPQLQSITHLCEITASHLEPLDPYVHLPIVRYLRQNNGEQFVKMGLHIEDVYRSSQELHRKLGYLLDFWDRYGLRRYRDWERNIRCQNGRMALARMVIVMRKCIQSSKVVLWDYHDMMLHQWASSSPENTASSISGVDPANRRDRSDDRNRDVRKQILDTTDHDTLLDRGRSLELSSSNTLSHSSMSGLTMGLSMRPTQRLGQQYVQSTVNSPLSTSDNFLRTSPKIASLSTTGSDLSSEPHVFYDFTEAVDTALSASKADFTVGVTKGPCQHPLSPLGYRIPEKNMADAKAASPGTRASYWQYLLYRGPKGEKIKVHYCKSKATTERIAQLFLNEEVVGFDIEWKPQALATEGVKKNVALIQLASEERIALFHIARYWEDEKSDDLLAPTLKKIMESTRITKVGVSIKADCTRLRKFMGIDSRSLFELSHLYKLVKFSSVNVKMINKTLVSLSRQVEEHLELPMWKGEVRSSDWSQELNYEQIYYAASDSYAGFQLYHVLEGKRRALDPPPPRPSHADLNLPIRLANGQTVADYDEGADAAEEILTELPPDPSISLEEMARDFLNVAVEDVPAQSESQRKPATTQPRSATRPEVAAADEWVSQWRNNLPSDYKARAAPASLRAYALWHHQDFDVPDVAALLRDPPLKEATVANYVLEAIRIEKLPHAGRQKLDMVIYHLNKNVQGRYQRL